MQISFTARSRNVKVGPIPTVIAPRSTCWDGCPFKDSGCYANNKPLVWHWDKLSSGAAGITWDQLCCSVAALPLRQVWRYAVAGDLPGDNGTIDWRALFALVRASRRKCGYAYTHKPMDNARNRRIIATVNRAGGFVINLSGNNPAHADTLADLGIAPVVTVLPVAYGRKTHKGKWAESVSEWRDRTADLPKTTPAGRRIAICPATYTDTTCADCKVCAIVDRLQVVGFPAHGSSADSAEVASLTA